jgi:hypothetical protein
MKDDNNQKKLGRYSIYIGLSSLLWWGIIFTPFLRVSSDVEGIKDLLLGSVAALQNIIGFILGVIALIKKQPEKKYAIFGVLINAPIIIIAILFVLIPLIIGYATGNAKRVPDEREIMTRFSEVLIQPRNIQGISAFGKDGKALFKYYTQSNNFIQELEQKASSKGWTKTLIKDSRLDFAKENHQRKNGKIILYQYDRLRIAHSDQSGLVCVGYDDIVSLDKVEDFQNNVDMKAIQFTLWPQIDSCAAGN